MITKAQVENRQKQWAEGIVKIGSLKNDFQSCKEYTLQFINDLYDFDNKVLFKPTKAAEVQFRDNLEAALSYFIGKNDQFLEDQGFATTPWTKVRFENKDIILEEKRAIAMGNYFFTDVDGQEAKVEYTFSYKVVGDSLKIDVHHSSLPYTVATIY